jgi:acetyl-CoA acetyltransferase
VDLRGRLSNHQVLEALTLAEQAVATRAVDMGVVESASTSSASLATRPWRVIDRLGEKLILDLLADRRAGATKQALVERYGISRSSVKRLVRKQAP